MSAVAFLVLAMVVAALGGLILWLRHRTPRTVEFGIDEFRREMEALAPPPERRPDDPDASPDRR